MRARLRIIVFVALFVLLGGMAVLVRSTLRTNAEFELAQRALELVPDAAQRIKNFHRVQVRDGRKEWEIAAEEARYFESEERVVVRRPMVRLYLDDGRSVAVTGEEGVVTLDGRELRGVEVGGASEVTLADYVVRTQSAHYDRARDLITADGGVEISGADLDARGTGMQVEVGAQRFRLLDDVQMVIKPKGADAGSA
jgi:LPS export ABC transporter protein LptC